MRCDVSRPVVIFCLLVVVTSLFAGCEKNGTARDGSTKIDRAADKTKAGLTKAADATARGLGKAANGVKVGVTKGAEGVKQGAEAADKAVTGK